MTWYATKAPYWEGNWASGTMSAGRDHAECVWSVSTDPNAPGWNTDGGTTGYGVPEYTARLMAAAPDMRTLLKAFEHNVSLVANDAPHIDLVEWKREMRRWCKKARKLLAETPLDQIPPPRYRE